MELADAFEECLRLLFVDHLRSLFTENTWTKTCCPACYFDQESAGAIWVRV